MQPSRLRRIYFRVRGDAMVVGECGFCRPGIVERTLWESEHYRVIADEYPRCAGHVLLVAKEHLPSHMHAPVGWMPGFEATQSRVRQFLGETFGKAAFYENGGARQEVPHAHLHGLPFDPVIKPKWLDKRRLERIESWDEARTECELEGHYFYLETESGRFLVRDYKWILNRVRGQLVGQTEARIDEDTGKMLRGGPEMVARTRELWNVWQASHTP